MVRNIKLEESLARIANQITMAAREMYSNPQFAMRLLDSAERSLQAAEIDLIKANGGKVKT